LILDDGSGVSGYLQLVKIRDLSLGDRLPQEVFTLKLMLDRKHQAIYIQAYAPEPLAQVLYRLDLKSQQLNEVYRVPKPVRFNPTYTPGAFDFTLSDKYLYISDIYDYKVYLYSLEGGAVTKTLVRPYDPRPIEQQDGHSTSARWKSRDWAKVRGYTTIPRSSI